VTLISMVAIVGLQTGLLLFRALRQLGGLQTDE
jgi:hypothetical protein